MIWHSCAVPLGSGDRCWSSPSLAIVAAWFVGLTSMSCRGARVASSSARSHRLEAERGDGNSCDRVSSGPYSWRMATEQQATPQEQIEDALAQTLRGWGAELDDGRKFWWGDWTKMIGDAITAVRTGEPVLYPMMTSRNRGGPRFRIAAASAAVRQLVSGTVGGSGESKT